MSCASRQLLWSLLLVCLPALRAGAQESHAAHAAPHPAEALQPPRIAPVTDADRALAFPDLGGASMKSHMDDEETYYLVLLDRLELQGARGETPVVWDATAWIGTDRNRLYLRSEGEAVDGTAESASIEAFWARPVARWWNLAVGLRQDVKPESSRSWLAVGAVGLAPYRINVEATAYLGAAGRTALRLNTEYDLLLTNRLILQPRLELNVYGRDDAGRGIGSGISSAEAGLRLRYEIRRELAPYAGVIWTRSFGTTADLARAAGRDDREVQAVAGLRIWF